MVDVRTRPKKCFEPAEFFNLEAAAPGVSLSVCIQGILVCCERGLKVEAWHCFVCAFFLNSFNSLIVSIGSMASIIGNVTIVSVFFFE